MARVLFHNKDTGEWEYADSAFIVKPGESSGSDIAIDTTLTQSGQAADAKAVGDALEELEGKISKESGGGIYTGPEPPEDTSMLWIDTDDESEDELPPVEEQYVLPAATADNLGGIKADPKTETDTQPVRIGEDGKLYTAQSGGETAVFVGMWEQICDITTTEEITAIEVTENSEGVPLSELKYNEIWVTGKFIGSDNNKGSWWKCIGTNDLNKTVQAAQSGGTTGTKYSSFYLFIRGNKAYATDGAGIDPFDVNSGHQNWLDNFLDYENCDHFISITLQGTTLNTDFIAPDTEIRILGRRC